MVRRRQILLSTAATAAALAAPALLAASGPVDRAQAAAHALNRLGFGPAPGDLARVAQDPAGWIDLQLAPGTLALPTGLQSRLREAEILATDPVVALREYLETIAERNRELTAAAAQAAEMAPSMQGMAPQRTEPNAVVRYVRRHQVPAIESRLRRALESPRQLEEVMVDFWFNHFNVFQGKNLVRVLVGHYEHYAIRPYALGRFRDLLGATAHHPAMQFYLDNWMSTAERPGGRGLNENYARELMELHTLGVDGGYSQADVTQLARMFTGWGFQPPRQRLRDGSYPTGGGAAPGQPADMPGFLFNARAHDSGSKIWLGEAMTARGKAEGDYALDRLAVHPATARHIGFKLAQYFVADQPDAALVDQLARVFLAEDGQIVPVLRSLFSSDAFWAPGARGAKFKTPYHYALSAVRAAGLGGGNVQLLAGALAAQGMPLYGCPTPDGWRNTEGAWLNPDGLARRINFASQLARARLATGEGPQELDDLFVQLGPLVSEATRTEALSERRMPELAWTLVLAGPAMMRR